jgi:hypothetical protein
MSQAYFSTNKGADWKGDLAQVTYATSSQSGNDVELRVITTNAGAVTGLSTNDVIKCLRAIERFILQTGGLGGANFPDEIGTIYPGQG